MRKVVILTSVHPPFDKRVFRREARTLAESGYKVTLIAPHYKEEVVDNVRIMPIPHSRNRFIRMLRTWHVFRLALKEKADLYHFHDPELLPATLLLKWITHRPIVYDIHEYNSLAILTKYWIPSGLRGLVSRAFDRVEKCFVKRFSAVVTVSDHMTEMFLPYNLNSITVCNYPVLKDYNPDSIASIETPKTIIYLGVLSKERGFELVLEVIPRVKERNSEADFLLVGQLNREGLTAESNSKITRCIENDYVRTPGEVPFKQAMEYLRWASIAWIPWLPTPNNQFGTPVKLFEYALYGKPIVASNFGIMANLIEEMGCGLLVSPDDPEEHAKAISYLLEYPERGREMGELGRKAVLERYNWERESKKMLALYDRLLIGA